ncbi:proton-conducting transporter transmembrane domain-containing protein [Nannocystis radixulma]|uniref:Proton-conducting transporter membrane subunit n=1 Tax=Nannocystis radixulma TaxID=2995305 RepID=A0ABT5B5J6_9BACT|nr:proton-conducting transporter membrane subunit [Nannocystis radixulma]MDC0669384.1 proton-conducting transporter membrane subunit [Nannocystis radixulma]
MTFDLLALAIPVLWLVPLLGAFVVQFLIREPTRQRDVAIGVAWVVFFTAFGVFLANGWDSHFVRDDLEAPLFMSLRFHMAVDGLNAMLLPMTAAIALASLLSTPRSDLRGNTAARILAVLGTLLGCFLALDAATLALFWIGSMLPLWQDTRRSKSRPLHLVMTLAIAATAIALVAALVLMAQAGAAAGMAAPFDLLALARAGTPLPPVIGWLFLFAALLRMGIFPLHLWLTAAGWRAPGYSAMPALFTSLGSFGLARVVMPLFPSLCEQVSGPLVMIGAVTALYGALLAVGQYDLRRVIGYFWVSQMGLVLTGLATLNAPGVSGALLQAMSSVVEVCGLMLIALEVEARAGTTDMRLLGGLVRRAPRLTTGFLLLSASAVGFPGTISFVAEDLAIQGLLYEHQLAAALLLVVTAINGVALFKAFKQTFLGPGSQHAKALRSFADLRGWEYRASVALMAALLIGGLVPQPLLAVRAGAVEALHKLEPAIALGDHHPATLIADEHEHAPDDDDDDD